MTVYKEKFTYIWFLNPESDQPAQYAVDRLKLDYSATANDHP